MNPTRIGVVSDTHGLLRPAVLALFQGVDHIIHAGDVGNPDILTQLETIAPVTAVRGNCDHGPWADALPHSELLELNGAALYILHDLNDLGLDPAAAGIHAVISGHTHRPLAEHKNGVLYLNPGSAGPRRFSLPLTAALLTLDNGQLDATIHTLAA